MLALLYSCVCVDVDLVGHGSCSLGLLRLWVVLGAGEVDLRGECRCALRRLSPEVACWLVALSEVGVCSPVNACRVESLPVSEAAAAAAGLAAVLIAATFTPLRSSILLRNIQ